MHDHDAVGEDPVEHGASARERTRRTVGGRIALLGAAGLVLGAYGWWAVTRPPFSGTATMAVLVSGVAAATVGGRRRPRRWPDVAMGTTVPWIVLVVGGGLWQLAAYVRHPREDHPTLSSLANGLLDSQPARVAAFVAWAAAMVGLSRR